MRASRLISLVLLSQSRGSMTAAELARELEVSERTVPRDVADGPILRFPAAPWRATCTRLSRN